MAIRIIRKLRDLLDVDTSAAVAGDALVLDVDGETWIPGAGGGGADDQTAAEVPFTPAGNIAATNVQTAIQELDSEKAAAASAVLDGDAAGGVLAGTYPSPSFAADMATQAELDAHTGDTSDAHDASAISVDSTTLAGTGTDVQAVLEELDDAIAAAGAPATADYLVGTTQGGLSAEIVVGTSPGGELGGSWASPTVDATHSGSTHASVQSAAEATAAAALAAHEADTTSIHGIADTSALALTANVQPLDSDLTAIAALTTTSFGRGLLELANAAALLAAAGAQGSDSDLTAIAALAPANDDVIQRKAGAWTNRTLAQLISDLAALGTTFQPLDSDLTAIAALTTTSFGRGLLAEASAASLRATLDLEAGTDFPSLATFNDHSARHEDGGADEISIAGLSGTPADLQTHLDDATDAHDASAISVLDEDDNYTATNVESALAEIATSVSDHVADTTAAHTASAISFSPTGTIASTDVQAAIAEVASEAVGVTYEDSNLIIATEVYG